MTTALVVHASKMGSTAEIADVVAEELRAHGITVDVRPARDVGSLDGYDAVVIGTAVYAGRWRPEATRFVRAHQRELTARSVHVFESGWVGKPPPTPAASPGGRRRAARIGAAEPVLFGGNLDPARARGPIDRMLARRMAGDFRDWERIREWAAAVAAQIAHQHTG